MSEKHEHTKHPEHVEYPERILYIMRGLPGSGKSTKVKEIIKERKERKEKLNKESIDFKESIDYTICSADDFFVDKKTGKYNFVHSKLPQAHSDCYSKAHSAVFDKIPIVIIDNTNVKQEHFKKYFELAKSWGYSPRIIDMHDDLKKKKGKKFTSAYLEKLQKRNVHNVPLKVISNMAESYSWYKIIYDDKYKYNECELGFPKKLLLI
jgi:predicted kinase